MDNRFIKNIDHCKTIDLAGLLDYRPGQVISLTMAQSQAMSMTLFAFAQGEGVSTHSAPGDAFVYILDGKADINIGDSKHIVEKGQSIIMPANIPHGLEAIEPFKMLLIVVKQ